MSGRRVHRDAFMGVRAFLSLLACNELVLNRCAVGAVDIRTEKSLKAAVKKRPKNYSTHFDLASWYIGWGDTQKSVAALRHAITVDPENAWRYHEGLGDLQYEKLKDLDASEESYRLAVLGTLQGNRSLLRYGELRIWKGSRKEANKLFKEALRRGELRNTSQRPVREFLPELPVGLGFWSEASLHPILISVVEQLTKLLPVARTEFQKWSKTRAKDAEVDAHLAIDHRKAGRRLNFWIHRPRFERGIWRDACSYKTPKTCDVLKSINASGVLVFSASFDILEPGAIIRPHCHDTNRELFIDVVLSVPQGGRALLRADGTALERSTGDVRVLDGSFEHEEINDSPPAANQGAGIAADSRVILRLVIRHPSATWRPGDDEPWWQIQLRRLKHKSRGLLLWLLGAPTKAPGEL
eukprot:TRINITY_DN12310_c0_g1_i1.p1 TRINITY_DN12310_c0_g1~~TRINITY_DN12310_c0_g1_i1.p1  ORF type:complete len:411 (-),score=22.23 TRINITY_DN12310_c0_g1_i1:57-1289(-)